MSEQAPAPPSLPDGYVVSVACPTCGMLRFDRAEDLPLHPLVAPHILTRHKCSAHDASRVALIVSELHAAVRCGHRATLTEIIATLDGSP